MNMHSWFSWNFSCMLQCCSFSFTFAMKQFTFIEFQFLVCICRKNLIHKVCSIAMYLSDHEESACNAGDPGPIPWSGRSPGGGNGNLLQILAWRIPWTEEPGRLQSTGSQRVRHDWVINIFTFLISQFFSVKDIEIITVGFCLRYCLTIQI